MSGEWLRTPRRLWSPIETDRSGVTFRVVAEGTAILVALLAISALVASLFGAGMPTILTGAPRWGTPAIFGLAILSVTALVAVPESRFLGHLTSSGPDGLVMRRILPLVFSPILVGWLRLKGEELGWYDTRFGVALNVFCAMLIIAAAAYWSVVVVSREATERRRAQEALAESEHRQSLAIEGAQIGIWEWSPASASVRWSQRCFEIFGLPSGMEPTLEELNLITHPEDRRRRAEALARSMDSGERYHIEYRILRPDGSARWIESFGQITADAAGAPQRMTGIFLDVDARKRAEEALSRSNADLERFAYVASHDLQEPLRMVASFVQLLAARYKGKLDETADEFIGYVVDGASRMQRMLDDLLAFSRLSRSSPAMAPTSADDALAASLRTLQSRIEESRATIEHPPLPRVMADASQLERVFANLIGNALKFRNGNDPAVAIAATREGPVWHFSVSDNGIGIDPRYFERVFTLFQRLHTRDEYEGNGMGLAITKRIIEQCGGTIWVTSEPDRGSTFHFTLQAPVESAA